MYSYKFTIFLLEGMLLYEEKVFMQQKMCMTVGKNILT